MKTRIQKKLAACIGVYLILVTPAVMPALAGTNTDLGDLLYPSKWIRHKLGIQYR
jgi:hypothetical protein